MSGIQLSNKETAAVVWRREEDSYLKPLSFRDWRGRGLLPNNLEAG